MRDTLYPAGYHNEGISYMNLDAWWQPIGEAGLERLRSEIHENGQRAGVYDSPFAFRLLALSSGCGREPNHAGAGPNQLHTSLLGRRALGKLRV